MKKLAWMAAVALLCGLVASPASAQRRERNRIRADEIRASNATSVYQLIQSRRGMWLMRNQTSNDMSGTGASALLVFMDGAQFEGVDDLRQLPTAGIAVIEFLTPAETEHKLGKYTTIGAIRILTRDDTVPADSTHAAHPR
jgi:outer membrane cobalamin receptor